MPDTDVEKDVLTDEDAEWLRARLHGGNCRQCDLVRALLNSALPLGRGNRGDQD